jgi:hypothetical protein
MILMIPLWRFFPAGGRQRGTEGDFMELLMIYKISPIPSLPKRGKERENFPKEGDGKGRNDPLDYAKSLRRFHLRVSSFLHLLIPSSPSLPISLSISFFLRSLDISQIKH